MTFSDVKIGALPRGDDLEVRVRVLEVEGAEMVDVREFVPSTETYGRGLLMSLNDAKPLAKLLLDAARLR